MRTVFVIDDDGLMREVLSRFLEKHDYRVRAFQSPRHALPLIDSGYPDAIVSDVQMPEMSGLELARCVRDHAPRTPVILMSGASSIEMSDEAERLGVAEFFEKPIKDMDRFAIAVDRVISEREDEEKNAGLDRLRLSFLTGLAHELRTPLTAIKLALENLFTAHSADRRSHEGRLLAISQRNIDRIIRLVEGQLDLLQITLGDVSVARRMVAVRGLLERAASETPPRVRKRVVVDHDEGDQPSFCFTDPDRLRAVVRYLLEAARSDETRPLTARFAVEEEGRKVRIRFDGVSLPTSDSDTGLLAPAACASGGAAGDAFETRAFHRIVASLGGEIVCGGTGGDASVSLVLPVAPRFDAREDFDAPIGCLREAAMLSGRTVSLLKCAVEHRTRNGACFSAEEKEFFAKCLSALSEGDALVRGRPDGTYYLGLVERGAEEIDHIVDFLRTPGPSGSAAAVEIETGRPGAAPSGAAGAGAASREVPSVEDGDLAAVGQGSDQ